MTLGTPNKITQDLPLQLCITKLNKGSLIKSYLKSRRRRLVDVVARRVKSLIVGEGVEKVEKLSRRI